MQKYGGASIIKRKTLLKTFVQPGETYLQNRGETGFCFATGACNAELRINALTGCVGQGDVSIDDSADPTDPKEPSVTDPTQPQG